MSIQFRTKALLASVSVALIAAALVAPTALGTLSGSGNATDIVELDTTINSISTLSSAANVPVAGASAFTMTNLGSNVDTFIRYDFAVVPSITGGATSITIRGATTQIADTLMFKQEVVRNAGTTTSEIFSPLAMKSATPSAGNACTGWTGTPDGGFSAAAAGTFTMKSQTAAALVNDAPTATAYNYCLDVTNNQVYISTDTVFAANKLIKGVTVDSAGAVLKAYTWSFIPAGRTTGNEYCLSGITGTGTSATPNLVQCQKFPYETQGVTTSKLYPLFDPPQYFPSANQNVLVSFAVTGTQWNPYASGTTNAA